MIAGSLKAQSCTYWVRKRGGMMALAAPAAARANLQATQTIASHDRKQMKSELIEAAMHSQRHVQCRDSFATSAAMSDIHRLPSEDGMDRTARRRQTRSSSPLLAAGGTRGVRESLAPLLDSFEPCTADAHFATRSSDPAGCDRGDRGCAKMYLGGSVVRCSSGWPCLI